MAEGNGGSTGPVFDFHDWVTGGGRISEPIPVRMSGIGANIGVGIGGGLGGFRGAGSRWKVDPDVLESTADATTAKIKEYETALEKMKSLLDQTMTYWEGDSADAYRKVFLEEYNVVADALATYREYPTRLLEDAGIYRRTETKAEALATAINTLDLF